MKQISLREFLPIAVGHAQDYDLATGCTVILCETGMAAACSVAGGGPASRETTLLEPTRAAEKIHALVLSGGSAFGLGAAGGVMTWLAERGYGFDTGVAKVPLVPQSCIFDLGIGDAAAYPDEAMAQLACEDAVAARAAFRNPAEGCVGAGTGATVGKLLGADTMMKSGIGIYAVQSGALKIGALAVVNALGDVFDYRTGRELAGMLTPDKTGFLNSEDVLFQMVEDKTEGAANTTLVCLFTNAIYNKGQLTKIAEAAQDGLSRAIRPVHTMLDGDTVYIVSTMEEQVGDGLNLAAPLAAYVTTKAIERAVLTAEPMYGVKAASDFF